MAFLGPFLPHYTSAVSVTTEANYVLISIDANAKSVRIVNKGANGCYISIGNGVMTCSENDLYVRANSEIVIGKAMGLGMLGYIQDTAPTALQIMTGEGGI